MPLEHSTYEGRPVLIAYLNDRFEMVEPDEATVIKITFTDEQGGAIFATAEHESPRSG